MIHAIVQTKTWLNFYTRLRRLAKLGPQSAIFTGTSTYRGIVVFQPLAWQVYSTLTWFSFNNMCRYYRQNPIFLKGYGKAHVSYLQLSTQLGSDRLQLPEVILSGCQQFLCMVTSVSKLSHLCSSVLSLRWKKSEMYFQSKCQHATWVRSNRMVNISCFCLWIQLTWGSVRVTCNYVVSCVVSIYLKMYMWEKQLLLVIHQHV